MRISFDRDRCSGHARCAVVAPEVYPLDDSGYCCVGDQVVPVELEQAALTGARNCPEGAIQIVA